MPEENTGVNRVDDFIDRNGLRGRIDMDTLGAKLRMSDAGKTGITLKILSVIGGLIASSMLSGFFVSSGLLETPPALMVSGILFIGGALWMNRKADHLVLDTFSISVFLLGFAHLAWAMSKSGWELEYAILALGGTALFAFAVTKGYMLSLFSALIVSSSMLLLLVQKKWYDGIHAYVVLWLISSVWLFFNEARALSWGDKASRQYPPVRVVAILSLIVGLFLVCNRNILSYNKDTLWITSLATLAGVLFVADSLTPIFGLKKTNERFLYLACALLLVIPLWFAPALTGSLLIVLLGFRTGDRTTFALGILAFLYFTVQYYYDLEMTLLNKSYVMMSTGFLFLGLYLVSNKKLKSLEKG